MINGIIFIKALKLFNTLIDAKEFCRNRNPNDIRDVYIIRKLHFEKICAVDVIESETSHDIDYLIYAVDVIEFENSHDIDYLIDTVERIMCENDCYYYYMYFSRLNILGSRTMCCIALDESY